MRSTASVFHQAPSPALIFGALAVLATSVVADTGVVVVAPLVIGTALIAAWHKVLLSWSSLLGLVVIVVLFVPIKSYRLPGDLPFDLEPYRVLVALLLLCWSTSLLVDPAVTARRSAFDGALALLVVAVIASELANPSQVQALSSYVTKSLTFFLAFLFLYFFIVSVVRDRRTIEALVRLLVVGGAIVSVFSIVERRTGYNVFYQLESVFPPLRFEGGDVLTRAGRLRVYGSAQHPIALGAAFAILIPLAVYVARTSRQRAWWAAAALLVLGVLATSSRTAILMLLVAGLVFLWLKPAETRRFWPALLPALVAVHFVLPGALGTIKQAFFPPGGLVAEQTVLAPGSDPQLAGGRIRLIGPSLDEVSRRPLFGGGYGTRITGFDNKFRNAPILDNQWLGTLLELGVVGFGALIWLFVRATRRLGRAAKAAGEGDDWLFVGFAASIASFGVGMLTYDAFSFIQVTFLFWIVLALAAAYLSLAEARTQTAGVLP